MKQRMENIGWAFLAVVTVVWYAILALSIVLGLLIVFTSPARDGIF